MRNASRRVVSLAPPDAGPPTGVIRTFLADDSPFMLALLAKLLSKDERISIVGSATDGRKAICCASSLNPDLVLTDLHLPGPDGVEITRRLKKQANPPTVIVVTSDNSPESRARCLTAGADAFLLKGADLPAQLRAAIENSFHHSFVKPKPRDFGEPIRRKFCVKRAADV